MFRDYVEGIYKIKSTTTNPTEKATSKSLLKALLGIFGLNIHKGVTKLVDVNSEYYNKLVQTVEITSFILSLCCCLSRDHAYTYFMPICNFLTSSILIAIASSSRGFIMY